MTEIKSPKVFISYSHDSEEHMASVFDLSEKLREEGVDCNIDQYETSPAGGWPRWTRNQIKEADYVLVVCTQRYEGRYEATEAEGGGAGAKWEGAIITQQLYEAEGGAHKFIPVVFAAEATRHIPLELRGATFYILDDDGGYEDLYRQITGQPKAKKGPVGKLKPLSSRERKQDFSNRLNERAEAPRTPAKRADEPEPGRGPSQSDNTEERPSNIGGEVRLLARDGSVLLYARRVNITKPGTQTLLSWSEYGEGIELLIEQIHSARTHFAVDAIVGVNEAGLSIAAYLSGVALNRCHIGYLKIEETVREEWLPIVGRGCSVMLVDVELKSGGSLRKALSVIRKRLKPKAVFFACLGAQAKAAPVGDVLTADSLESSEVLGKARLDGFFAAFIGPPPLLEPPLYLT